jgi:hypothetical protein
MTVAKHPRAIAWGCLPTARSELPSVESSAAASAVGHSQQRRRVSLPGSGFAGADGRFSQVVATSQESRESCRLRTVDAC